MSYFPSQSPAGFCKNLKEGVGLRGKGGGRRGPRTRSGAGRTARSDPFEWRRADPRGFRGKSPRAAEPPPSAAVGRAPPLPPRGAERSGGARRRTGARARPRPELSAHADTRAQRGRTRTSARAQAHGGARTNGHARRGARSRSVRPHNRPLRRSAARGRAGPARPGTATRPPARPPAASRSFPLPPSPCPSPPPSSRKFFWACPPG